jgi:hypothetical protein
LKKRFHAAVTASLADAPVPGHKPGATSSMTPMDMLWGDDESSSESEATATGSGGGEIDTPQDIYATYTKAAIQRVANEKAFIDRIRTNGIPWMGIVDALKKALPDVLDNRDEIAYNLVSQFLTETFGEQGKGWYSENRPKKSGSGMTTWVALK